VLFCDPLSGTLLDTITKKEGITLKCVKECKLPKADEGQIFDIINGSLSVKCKSGYFPEVEVYQTLGEQRLKCQLKGQWYDAKANMTSPMDCIKGCITRPTLPPDGEVEIVLNTRRFNVNGIKSVCKKGE
jgi:hypothetical protein